MGRQVGRLARDLPQFESVWIDALARARILTRFQATEINAGRGERLRIGPYVLDSALGWPGYVGSYRARHIESGEWVRLAVVENNTDRSAEITTQLNTLTAASRQIASDRLAPITQSGQSGQSDDRIWAASRWVEGGSAGQWTVHNGRFPAEAVLEIARAMAAGLKELEAADVCHGDIGASAILLTHGGGVVLPQPGLRGIVRPEEGFAHADLRPEAYDYLAPERITDGTPPDMASDLYACGCVWWHLLCGRPPLAGGDSVAKLRSGQEANVYDPRRLVPDMPDSLARAISSCLQSEPSRRAESMARLSAMLGSSTACGRSVLANCLARPERPTMRRSFSPGRTSSRGRSWVAPIAIVACLAVAAIVLEPIWAERTPLPTADIAARHPETRPESGNDSAPPVAVPQPLPSPSAPAGRRGDGDLVLACGGPLRIESLAVKPGQTVRGEPGRRPMILVPWAGLPVDVEDVCFENIDFLYDHGPVFSGDTSSGRRGNDSPALVQLNVARAEFRGCSFRSTRLTSRRPTAVRWTHPSRRDDVSPDNTGLTLRSGTVRLSDCILYRVDAAVDCRTVGALGVELTNVLHCDSGPLVRLDHCPTVDEPIVIALVRMTLRDSGPMLQCDYRRVEDRPGDISIRTNGCVLVPQAEEPLILLAGPDAPGPMVRSIRWSGQGSLVSPEAPIAVWRSPAGQSTTLDESSISIDGLVRSRVEFAGDAKSDPPASRITRWQVPLRSTEPPGIDPDGFLGFDNPDL